MTSAKNKKIANAASGRDPADKAETRSPSPSWWLADSWQLRTHFFVAAAIAIITWLVLQPCLANTITAWDDTAYLRDDVFIKDISWQGIKAIFSKPVMGNYHPLTILSFAWEYSQVQLDPWLYHFHSLLLHTMVTVLVYAFVVQLARRPLVAVVAALLFGLHPLHIESVAWVSGRKDLLCALFYVASCMAWLGYLRAAGSRRALWYVVALFLFIFSLLSKGVAVTLPLTLWLIDYYEGRSFRPMLIIEKIPHLLLSLALGVITFRVQHAAGAMDMLHTSFSPIERLALGCYALTTYLWKALLPLDSHCLYPYPDKVNGVLPFAYYLYPLVCIALAVLVWRFSRRSRIVVFGSLFFLANIILLLQFIQVGESVVAERYFYIPCIGLFFMAGWLVYLGLTRLAPAALKPVIIVAAILYTGLLGYQSHARCSVWYDELSLWSDEVISEPARAPQAWNNIGYYYSQRWAAASTPQDKQIFMDSAFYALNKAIAARPAFVNPYLIMGEMQRASGLTGQARTTYLRAFALNPKNSNLPTALAISYFTDKRMDSAGYWFRKAIEIGPSSASHGNLGNYYEAIDKNDSALMEYNRSVEMSTTNHVLYVNRAKLLKKLNRWPQALADIETALRMNPDLAELYYLRSFCDTQQHNNARARQDADKAISLGYPYVDNAYYQSLKNK